MKTTGVGPFLGVAIVLGLLTAPSAVAAKDEQAKKRMQAADQNRLVVWNKTPLNARARHVVPGQPADPGTGSTMIAPLSVADGSVRTLKTLPATGPRNVSGRTVLAAMPSGLWCKLFPNWRGCSI